MTKRRVESRVVTRSSSRAAAFDLASNRKRFGSFRPGSQIVSHFRRVVISYERKEVKCAATLPDQG